VVAVADGSTTAAVAWFSKPNSRGAASFAAFRRRARTDDAFVLGRLGVVAAAVLNAAFDMGGSGVAAGALRAGARRRGASCVAATEAGLLPPRSGMLPVTMQTVPTLAPPRQRPSIAPTVAMRPPPPPVLARPVPVARSEAWARWKRAAASCFTPDSRANGSATMNTGQNNDARRARETWRSRTAARQAVQWRRCGRIWRTWAVVAEPSLSARTIGA
jgi:hypothetical protein